MQLCHTHQISFTIYPPGYVPYGRKKLAPVGPDGLLETEKSGTQRFEGTYFDAALDAADGRFWTAESITGSQTPRYQTQLRHLERATIILGIHPDIDDKHQELFSHILNVAGQLFNDNKISDDHLSQDKGVAICNILAEIAPTQSLFERIVEAGSLMSLWPMPQVWRPGLSCFKNPSFRQFGTRASPE